MVENETRPTVVHALASDIASLYSDAQVAYSSEVNERQLLSCWQIGEGWPGLARVRIRHLSHKSSVISNTSGSIPSAFDMEAD